MVLCGGVQGMRGGVLVTVLKPHSTHLVLPKLSLCCWSLLLNRFYLLHFILLHNLFVFFLYKILLNYYFFLLFIFILFIRSGRDVDLVVKFEVS